MNINYFVVQLSEFGAVFGDISAIRESKVSKGIAELLVAAGTSEFEFGAEAYIDCRIDRFIDTLGCL